jgi:hypothetical protein
MRSEAGFAMLFLAIFYYHYGCPNPSSHIPLQPRRHRSNPLPHTISSFAGEEKDHDETEYVWWGGTEMFIADDEITGCVDLIRGEEPQVCGAISGYRRRISTSVKVSPNGLLCLKRCRLFLRGLGVFLYCVGVRLKRGRGPYI